ncbi:MAG: methionyl-tRNA formyltransferase [Ignavibacteriae bacterium]|nr:MAG: methionyl-tRNA formyltransferase [Ignavibacteriota bacterium]
MKIVFFGATELGFSCCKLIIEKKLADIACIFTIPREFNISYSKTPVNNATFKDFSYFNNTYGIPVVNVTDKMKTYKEEIELYKPDLILVIGWYYMIPSSIRDIATKGCIGMHGSLLPKYRGGAPLVWAIINGEQETGISMFYLDDGIDDGDIIAQEKITIEPEDTIKTMIDKMTVCSLSLIENYLPRISNGTAPRIKQDNSKATYVPQRKPEDGLINWDWDVKKIKNFIRAQTKPYPGAFTIINEKKVTIWDADIEETKKL